MDGLISVIVNVYNCKEFLPVSLESVRQQTYSRLEVILVDDCSSDGSGEYCEEFCRKDERFRVIHHERNTGVSGPRNTGLREARGEYIYFLDGDDYLHAEALEALMDALRQTGADLAVFDFQRTDSLREDTHRPREKKPVETVPAERLAYEMLACVELKWCVSWNKLFKRSLLEGLFFEDYYSIQDQDFNIRVYQRIDRAAFVPEPLYWYYQNPGSLQRNPAYNAKRYYFNTLNRFKILDHIQPGKNEKKYREWIIGLGYQQIVARRKSEKGTDYEEVFRKTSQDIVRRTLGEFLRAESIPLKKKAKFLLSWYCPGIAGVYDLCAKKAITLFHRIR